MVFFIYGMSKISRFGNCPKDKTNAKHQRLCLNGCVSTVMSQLEASAKNYNRSDTCDSYIEMAGNSNPRCNVNVSPELWLGSTVSN